jgi:hypothetical protein
MNKFFLTICCFGFLHLVAPEATACSCLHYSLQKTIFETDEIVFGKLKTISKGQTRTVKEPSGAWRVVRVGKMNLSELQVLKGDRNILELDIPDFRIPINPFCNCYYPDYADNDLDETWAIVFLKNNEGTGSFHCAKPENCGVFLQRIKEMVEIQKDTNWEGSADEKRWIFRCLANKVTLQFVFLDFLSRKSEKPEIKKLENLVIDEKLRNDLEVKLDSPQLHCDEVYVSLAVAEWNKEKAVKAALTFLRNQKERPSYESCDGIEMPTPFLGLIPTLMYMVAEKTQIPDAVKFAVKFQEQKNANTAVIGEFLSFVEMEQQRRVQRKVKIALVSIVGLFGLALILYKFRKRTFSFANGA